jgi:hypothetical protein
MAVGDALSTDWTPNGGGATPVLNGGGDAAPPWHATRTDALSKSAVARRTSRNEGLDMANSSPGFLSGSGRAGVAGVAPPTEALQRERSLHLLT